MADNNYLISGMIILTASGENIADWICNLKNVLRKTRKLYVLDATISRVSYNDICKKDDCSIKNFMLTYMDRSLHTHFEKASACDVLIELQNLFGDRIKKYLS